MLSSHIHIQIVIHYTDRLLHFLKCVVFRFRAYANNKGALNYIKHRNALQNVFICVLLRAKIENFQKFYVSENFYYGKWSLPVPSLTDETEEAHEKSERIPREVTKNQFTRINTYKKSDREHVTTIRLSEIMKIKIHLQMYICNIICPTLF